MPLENPIIEAIKPSMRGARIVDGLPPENIRPILTLMQCRAVAYENDGLPMWELTTENGHYIRVQQHYILDDEAEWTRLIGMLLDYAKQQSEKS
jgi:hypothetical protein